MPKNRVRVFCTLCKGGDNHVWRGTLHEWAIELSRIKAPAWFNYILRHEKAHPGHTFMVEYPTKTVPFNSSNLEEEVI